jgi:hypothetical protein
MASVDLRGFPDTLAPLRKQRQWRLDQAVAAVSLTRKRLTETESERAEAVEAFQSESARVAQHWRERTDPTAYAHLLLYLAQQHGRVLELEAEEHRMRDELAAAQATALRRQHDLEVLKRHRSEALAEYRVGIERKMTAEADVDWSARSVVRGEAGL